MNAHNLGDLNQSAKNWLSYVLENFSTLLKNDEDPSLDINISGVKFQIRLMESPGQFKRVEIDV